MTSPQVSICNLKCDVFTWSLEFTDHGTLKEIMTHLVSRSSFFFKEALLAYSKTVWCSVKDSWRVGLAIEPKHQYFLTYSKCLHLNKWRQRTHIHVRPLLENTANYARRISCRMAASEQDRVPAYTPTWRTHEQASAVNQHQIDDWIVWTNISLFSVSF